MSILSIARPVASAGQTIIRQMTAVGGSQAEPTQNSAPESSAPVSLSRNAQARLENEQRFERYQSRINSNVRKFFTADDRRVIGEAYEIAEEKGRDMKKIDKLVYELGAFRIQQHMRGELVIAVVNQTRDKGDEIDAVPQVDLAHMPLLGKIREMNGAGG